ncbi:MAG TPA: hypothetical protein PLB21_12445, partial [Actinomycetota bacterium]|nr:hypothetical protein [Actinomycetota bacterium]
MIRGRRPAAPRGRRRIGLLAVGLLAALSLVWQQQASLASFTDKEFANASFSSATLSAIAPTMEPDPDRILVKWAAPVKQWATPQYQLYWSATGSGSGTNLHSGPSNDRQYNHDTGTNVPADANLLFTEVAAGDTHACGISQGTVYCWGTNDYGELGLGTTTAAAAPKAVTYGGLVGRFATDVTAGTDFTCAIADGQAFCWGRGASGRLGTGNSANATTPTAVTTNTMIGTVTSLSAGGSHACAVAAGVAYCWGLGDDGRLGNGASSGSQVNPIAVTTSSTPLAGRTISSISAGTSHSCAVADAMAFCWGLNTNGRLGDNTTTARTTAVAVLTSGVLMGRSVSRISAGAAHTCAIADAKAFCWGNGASGRLGNSTTSQSLAPVAVTTSSMSGSVSAISAGSAHTCAIASAAAWCWGAGTSYGLGNGSTANLSAPGTVTAAAGVLSERTLTSISTGTSFGCVTGNTPAACWGLGTSNQMGDNSATTNQTPANVILVGKVCANGSVRRSATACSLTQGTDYYYRLGYTIGAWSAPDSGWQKSTTAVRSGVTPSVNSSTTTSITLDWAAAEKAIQAYPEYTVQRSLVADGSSPTTIAITGVRLLTDPGGL